MDKSSELSTERNSPVFDHYEDSSGEVEDPRLGVIVPMHAIVHNQDNEHFNSSQNVPFQKVFRLERCIVDVEEFVSVVEKAEHRLNLEHENVYKWWIIVTDLPMKSKRNFYLLGFMR